MTLTLGDIEFRTELPPIPAAMPAAVTEAQCGHERTEAIRTLAAILDLGEAVDVALPFGHALASKTGQVEFFAASGAIRARNLSVINAFDDEQRPWPDVKKIEDKDGISYALGDGSVRQLLAMSRELLDKTGLADDGVADMDVVVGRWAHLDEKGQERESGPGRATVRLSYAIEGIPLIGPGAKTHLHYDPIGREPALARLFHCHRAVTDVREVETGGPERAFDAFLADPFLNEQYERGGRIVITAVQAGLLALPADTPQRVAYPALAVEGVVESLKDQKGDYELRFGRYVAAARPGALRRAGLAVPTPAPSREVDTGPA